MHNNPSLRCYRKQLSTSRERKPDVQTSLQTAQPAGQLDNLNSQSWQHLKGRHSQIHFQNRHTQKCTLQLCKFSPWVLSQFLPSEIEVLAV